MPAKHNSWGAQCWDPDEHGKTDCATCFGVLILSIGNFDMIASSFDAFFRVYFKFHHPNVQSLETFKETSDRVYYNPESLIEYVPGKNMVPVGAVHYERVPHKFYGDDMFYLVFAQKADPTGVLCAELRMKGVFTHRFALQWFPLDEQRLRLSFYMQPNNEVDMKREWFVNTDVPAADPGILEQPDYKADRKLDADDISIAVKDGSTYMHLNMHFARRPGYHYMAVTVPMSIIVVLAPTTYAIDPEEVADRLSVGMTLLLAAVAVKFIVAPDLPKVPYPTRLDVENIISYVFILVIILGQVYLKDYDEQASRVAHVLGLLIVAFFWRFAAVRAARRLFCGGGGGSRYLKMSVD